MQQAHEIGGQAIDGLGAQQMIVPGKLPCRAGIGESARVIGAAHLLARRLVITPGDFMAKHDFHCNETTLKLHRDEAHKNPGRNDKLVP